MICLTIVINIYILEQENFKILIAYNAKKIRNFLRYKFFKFQKIYYGDINNANYIIIQSILNIKKYFKNA